MKKYISISLITFLLCVSAAAQQRLTLAESIELALKNNTALYNSRLEADAAARIKTSAQTRYFPGISAGAIAFDVSRDLFSIRTPGGNLPVYDGNPANLLNATQYAWFPGGTTSMLGEGRIGYIDILQPVFAGGRIVNGVRLAALGQSVAVEKERITRNEVLLSTEEQYWRIVAREEKRKTLAGYLALLDRLLQQVEDACASGLLLRNDVLKVRLKHSEVLLNQSKLENGRKLALMAFCQHIGIAFDSTLTFTSPLPAVDNPQQDYRAPQTVLNLRPEYALLQKALRAEQLQTSLKRGEMLPSAAVGARAMVTRLDDREQRTLGLLFGTVSIPLSDWIGGSAELAERGLKEKIAANNLKNHSELLLLQMEKAWQDVNDACRQVRLYEAARSQAEENLRINEDSHRNGLTSVADLLEAQAMVQQTRDDLTDAQTDYCIKRKKYLQVTGR